MESGSPKGGVFTQSLAVESIAPIPTQEAAFTYPSRRKEESLSLPSNSLASEKLPNSTKEKPQKPLPGSFLPLTNADPSFLLFRLAYGFPQFACPELQFQLFPKRLILLIK